MKKTAGLRGLGLAFVLQMPPFVGTQRKPVVTLPVNGVWEGEIRFEQRKLGTTDPGRLHNEKPITTIGFRGLYGTGLWTLVHLGAGFTDETNGRRYIIPELGLMFRRKFDACSRIKLIPLGLGFSVSPLIPVKGDASPLAIMFNFNAEVGVGLFERSK